MNIKLGMQVRVKYRADLDTATVIANDVDGDSTLVRVEPRLFGQAIWARSSLIIAKVQS